MFKKILLILAGFVLAAGVLGAAGYAYAQATDSEDTTDAEGPLGRGDFFGWADLFRHGDWFGFGDGILHDYLLPAFAQVFDLDDGQVQAFEVVQETMDSIREALTPEEIQTKMSEARAAALDAAVADGTITQEQADQMLARQQMGGRKGPGGRGGGRMPMDGGHPLDGWGFDGRQDVLSTYMDAAWAEALDLSADEWQTLKAGGFNLVDYAAEQDLTVTEMQKLVKGVYTSAIEAALADDAITQEQADDLLTRVETMDGRMPFTPGRGGRGW